MKKAGICSKVSRKFNPQTTDSNHDNPIYENHLERQFVVPCANYAWCGDVTYSAPGLNR